MIHVLSQRYLSICVKGLFSDLLKYLLVNVHIIDIVQSSDIPSQRLIMSWPIYNTFFILYRCINKWKQWICLWHVVGVIFLASKCFVLALSSKSTFISHQCCRYHIFWLWKSYYLVFPGTHKLTRHVLQSSIYSGEIIADCKQRHHLASL